MSASKHRAKWRHGRQARGGEGTPFLSSVVEPTVNRGPVFCACRWRYRRWEQRSVPVASECCAGGRPSSKGGIAKVGLRLAGCGGPGEDGMLLCCCAGASCGSRERVKLGRSEETRALRSVSRPAAQPTREQQLLSSMPALDNNAFRLCYWPGGVYAAWQAKFRSICRRRA